MYCFAVFRAPGGLHCDVDWVAKEYLWRCKKGAWKKGLTDDAVKCWNLERILDAELHGLSKPEDLTADDLIAEMHGPSNAAVKEAESAEEPIVVD